MSLEWDCARNLKTVNGFLRRVGLAVLLEVAAFVYLLGSLAVRCIKLLHHTAPSALTP